MILTKMVFELFIFQLMARVCLAAIMIEVPTSEDPSNLIKSTATILKTCYQGQSNTIGIAGKSSDYLISALSSEADLSVVLIDIDSAHELAKLLGEDKLHMFVIMAASPTQLKNILRSISGWRWWNHIATFYIIDSSLEKNGCARAYKFLRIAWAANLLRVKFVCNYNATERAIYSFNPYTSDAPVQWKLEKIYSGIYNHPFALLVRRYIDDPKMCENIDFDATKNLGGYPIKVNDLTHLGMREIKRLTGNIMENKFRGIIRTLNATVIMSRDHGSCDIGEIQSNYIEAYPHYFGSVSIMSKYTGDKSQLSKIVSAIDRASRIGVILVCVITAIFLKYSLRQTPMTAFLSTVRLFCNSCLTKLPIDTPTRFYLTGLFILTVTIQGIYQGLLAALLAKRVPYPNIDTPEDLFESDNQVYVAQDLFDSVYTNILRDHGHRAAATEHGNCSSYMLSRPKSACIDFLDRLIPDAAQFKFHLSKEYYAPKHISFAIRRNWPVEQRFNALVQRLVESNTIQYTTERQFIQDWRTIEGTETENIDRTRKILEFSDLSFAFVILGIGLTLAMIIFVVENIFSRFVRSRLAKARRRFCPRLTF